MQVNDCVSSGWFFYVGTPTHEHAWANFLRVQQHSNMEPATALPEATDQPPELPHGEDWLSLSVTLDADEAGKYGITLCSPGSVRDGRVHVSDVRPNCGAVQVGDVVTSVNGQTVPDLVTALHMIHRCAGQPLSLSLRRSTVDWVNPNAAASAPLATSSHARDEEPDDNGDEEDDDDDGYRGDCSTSSSNVDLSSKALDLVPDPIDVIPFSSSSAASGTLRTAFLAGTPVTHRWDAQALRDALIACIPSTDADDAGEEPIGHELTRPMVSTTPTGNSRRGSVDIATPRGFSPVPGDGDGQHMFTLTPSATLSTVSTLTTPTNVIAAAAAAADPTTSSAQSSESSGSSHPLGLLATLPPPLFPDVVPPTIHVTGTDSPVPSTSRGFSVPAFSGATSEGIEHVSCRSSSG